MWAPSNLIYEMKEASTVAAAAVAAFSGTCDLHSKETNSAPQPLESAPWLCVWWRELGQWSNGALGKSGISMGCITSV
jgi:hypothetical protein